VVIINRKFVEFVVLNVGKLQLCCTSQNFAVKPNDVSFIAGRVVCTSNVFYTLPNTLIGNFVLVKCNLVSLL